MPTLAELDAAHHAQQAENARAVAQLAMARFIRDVDPENVAATSRGWLEWVIRAIFEGRSRSYQLALAYSTAVQRIQVPNTIGNLQIPRPPDPPVEQLYRSLAYTGPGDLVLQLAKIPDYTEVEPGAPRDDVERQERQRQSRTERIKKAVETSAAKSAAVAFKQTANGGRDTVDQFVVTKVAIGYQRITKEKPCAFCLMLASRGPVYQEDSFDESDARFTGPGNHKVHDSCSCALRPIFKRGEENWTETARTADQLWKDMLEEGKRRNGRSPSGKAAINLYASMARERGLADLSRW